MNAHSSSDIAVFDLKKGLFWVPWYNMNKGGWFDEIGLAAQGNFKFKVGFDIDTSDLTATDYVALSGLSGGGATTADASSLVAMGDEVAFGSDTLKYHGNQTYELIAGTGGKLDSVSSLKFDFEPLFFENGGRYTNDELYLADSDGPRFNNGEAINLTHVDIPAGSSIKVGSNEYTAADGWINAGAVRFGQFRLAEVDGELTLQYRDVRDAYSHHKMPAFEIITPAGVSTNYDAVSFYNIGDSVAAGVGNPAGFSNTTDVGGDAFPVAGHTTIYGLMPLEGEGIAIDTDGDGIYDSYSPTVKPTHTAVGSGDWDSDIWDTDGDGVIDAGARPDDGAIVHVPMGSTITGSGDFADGSHIFMVRVDGTLNITAPAGAETSLKVDTIFSTHHGTLNIDADAATDGTVDIAISPLDLNAHTFTHDAATEAYYSDSNNVRGWDDKRDGDATGSIGDNNGDGFDGVLGRFDWDPTQISLGVVSHGTTNFQGQQKLEHIAHDGIAQGATSFTVDFDPTTNGWAVDDRLMIGATERGELSSDGLITQGHEYFADKNDRDAGPGGLGVPSDASEVIRKLQSQDEVVTINAISNNGNGTWTISFNEVLEHNHIPRQFAAADAPNVSLSIANLTRNVTIRSDAATTSANSEISAASSISNESNDPTLRIGNAGPDMSLDNPVNLDGHLIGTHDVTDRGHFMAMHSDDVDISSVAFRGLGRTDKTAIVDSESSKDASLDKFGGVLGAARGDKADGGQDADAIVNHIGRYAVHLHQAGTNATDGNTGAWVSGSVVEGSVGWGYAHHGSEAILANNVSYDVVGTGFMAESGDETGIWYNNLSAKNSGFGVSLDPPAGGESNDFGKNGTAFWFEGRALAVVENTALSSKSGFVYQPFGSKNVALETAAMSDAAYEAYFAEINSRLGLTGTDALGVSLAENDGAATTIGSGDGDVLKNGFVPIRYFTDNTVVDAGVALSIVTAANQGARKGNDVWSHFDGLTAVNVDQGVFMQYTSKYLYEDFFVALSEGSDRAMNINSAAHELTLSNWIVELAEGTTDTGGLFTNSTSVGNSQQRFGDQFSPKVDFDALDRNTENHGYGATESQWDGFQGQIDPIFNLMDANFVNVRYVDPTTGAITTIDDGNTNSGSIQYEFEYIDPATGYYDQDSWDQFFDQAPAEKGVEIHLIDEHDDFGVVGLWREKFNESSHYGDFYYVDPESGEGRHEIPIFYLNEGFSTRSYGYNYTSATDDIWSGVLLQFDKEDSLGWKRYSHEVESFEPIRIYYSDAGTQKSFTIAPGDLESGRATYDAATDKYTVQIDNSTSVSSDSYQVLNQWRERVTTNEKVILSDDRINSILERDGFYTIDGMTYVNQANQTVDMKFAVVSTAFTDRLTGVLHEKKILVGLDEAWGNDGSIVFDQGMVTGQQLTSSMIDDSWVISDQYGHYFEGELQTGANGEPVVVDVPESIKPTPVETVVVSGTDGNDYMDAAYTGDPEGDMITDGAETVLAGLGDRDVVFGSGGADTLDGGAGTGDKLRYDLSNAAVNLDLSAAGNVQSGGHAEGDKISGFEIYDLSEHNDTFIGSDANEIVWPRMGQDRIETRGGNDSIRLRDSSYQSGGANEGQVKVFGHYIDGGEGYDAVSLKGAHAHSLTLTGDRNAAVNIVDVEQITGHHANDVISVTQTGGTAQDGLTLITGGGGNDTLSVTLESVTLTGGSGTDRFEVNGEGHDFAGDMDIVISDFNLDTETLVWRGVEIDLMNIANHPSISVSYDEAGTGKSILTDVDGTVTLEGVIVPSSSEPIVIVEGDQNPDNLNDVIDRNYLADPEGHRVTSGDDKLLGGLGDDTLRGWYGDDTYIYELGHGNDYVDDDKGFNTLDLSTFNMGDVSFRADGYHDLEMDFADGASVELNYQFRYGFEQSNRISEIIFADGTLNETQIHAKAMADQVGNATVFGTYGHGDTLRGDASDQTFKGGYGDDTYVYELGHGNDYIDDSKGFNTLDLSTFNMDDVSFRADGYHDLEMDFADGASVELNYQFRYGFEQSDRISEIIFADGTLNETQIHAKAMADQEGNATVFGSYGHGETLRGDASDQTFKGGYGDDTYVYELGHGNDVIDDSKGFNTLDLSTFNMDDVSFRANGYFGLYADFADGGSVEVHYQYRYGFEQTNRISEVVFADGTLNETQIYEKVITDQEGNETVFGTSAHGDTLRGDASDQTFKGGSGDDTYVYELGDGSDVIDDSRGFNTLDLSTLNMDDVSFRTDAGHDLYIDFADGASVELNYQYRYGFEQSNRISEIIFADGSLNETQIYEKAITDQEGNATVFGTYGHSDTLRGDASDQAFKGGRGDDTYVYELGDGSDVIDDSQGFNTLDLSTLNMDDVSFRTDAGHDLYIDFADGASVELNYQYRYGFEQSNRISEIIFADGSLNETQIYEKAIADQVSNASVFGTYGHSDTLQGDSSDQTFKGGSGSDVYVFATGDGDDTILDFQNGLDKIEFVGLEFDDLTITKSGKNAVIDYGGSDSVTVNRIGVHLLTEDDFIFS